MTRRAMRPRFFRSAAEFRSWLESHHATARELWVGFYKHASGKPGISYQDAVDEALCFGWIDGVKKRVDELRYTHRFTPRTPGSIWSVGNSRRVKELMAVGRMAPPGLEAFHRRDPKKTERDSVENRPSTFDAALARAFQANAAAWQFFRAQPPGYQRLATAWIMSARKDETRQRRLASMIKTSAEGRRMRWV